MGSSPSDVLYAWEVDLDLPRVARNGKPARRPIPPAEPRPAPVAVVLARALDWKRRIESGEAESQAAIAREHGLTRARVTQIMNLTLLAPDIQQEVLALKTRYANHPVTERKLRQVAHVGDWAAQRVRFAQLVAQADRRAHGANGGA